jgi:hypothetical protein
MPWLCEWCAIYGKYPPEKAYRPDDEEPVITLDGEKICQSCAKNWQREKKKAEKKHLTD